MLHVKNVQKLRDEGKIQEEGRAVWRWPES